MRAGPKDHLITGRGVRARLESGCVIGNEIEPCGMGHPSGPSLRIGLIGSDRTNIMTLSVI